MSCILHLDASARGERSISRRLSKEFIDGWKASHPSDTVVYRDVGRNPPPHVSEAWIVGAYTPPETHATDVQAAMQVSNALVDEFIAADRYVLGVPMYNFSMPSAFKAYVDQIIRVGRTFSAEGKGLLTGRKMVILAASGGQYAPNTPFHAFDHQEPWLRTIFGFVGITDIQFIRAEGVNAGDAVRLASLEQARQKIADLLKFW